MESRTATLRRAAATAILIVLLGFPYALAAQTTSDRRAELEAVIAGVSDPDPLARVAFYENLIAEGDQMKLRIARKTALSIDDPNLHMLALKSFIAQSTNLDFEVKGAEDIDKNFERGMESLGLIIPFIVSNLNIKTGTFDVAAMSNQTRVDDRTLGTGAIAGSEVRIASNVYLGTQIKRCNLRASLADGVLDGYFSCPGWGRLPPKIPVQLALP